MQTAKPFSISKRMVWEAYKRVKANQGAAGVDEESLADFEGNLANNLYKLWNRLASGSYFPPPVRTVAIPKHDGGQRLLGIPTVSDRIAQTVVAMALEPVLEPVFRLLPIGVLDTPDVICSINHPDFRPICRMYCRAQGCRPSCNDAY